MTAVTFVEVGGDGGVYQHTLAAADALAHSGLDVTLLSSDQAEVLPEHARFQEGFRWYRGRPLRGVRVVLGFLFRTIPAAVRAPGVIWVQGMFRPELTLLLLVVLRCARRRVIVSPHNLFPRDGGRTQRLALDACLRLAHGVAVYNTHDQAELVRRKLPCRLLPLLQHAPSASAAAVARWRSLVSTEGIRVASVGQIRSDKNIPMLVEACDRAGLPLLVAGADINGAAAAVEDAVTRSGTPVVLHKGYLDLDDLAAALSVIRLVALPYSIASQSGVAEVAHRYGAVAVGYRTGGLTEQVDTVVDTLEPSDWARALGDVPDERSLEGPIPPVLPPAGVEDYRSWIEAVGAGKVTR